MEKKYTPAEVLAAAKVLFPGATAILKAATCGVLIKQREDETLRVKIFPNIDWQGLESYEEPKPWRPAEWPKDWGKMAVLTDAKDKNFDAESPTFLCGRNPMNNCWISPSGLNWKYAWVREE